MPTNPAPDRTIVVDGVRLTEAQVRAAVKALEVPPLLTRADIKPGEYFAFPYYPKYAVYMALETANTIYDCFDERKPGTDAYGKVGYTMQACAVVRCTGFTDTGGAS